MKTLQKIIFILFAILLFLVPLILWPYTSEVFEFNKIVLVYALTTLIAGTWIVRMIIEKKFIFRRTILDIPLLVFLGSELISTLLSIDPLTSWLGYYSRFNGGLLSLICYSLLYWAFVSNLNSGDAKKLITHSMLPSAFLVSVYGVAEHFGIDKSIWVQDVQSRVFSTLGQPNWLAAWLVALIPITWAYTITNYQLSVINKFSRSQFLKFLVYFGLSILFFWTIIFTKSRSGLAGFAVAFFVFWGFHFWTRRKEFVKHLAPFAIISGSILAICLISGTQYTPGLKEIISKSANKQISNIQTGGTALETGGTESGTIRKIVWKGAVQIWLHYPVFGTGVETFAFSYYLFRPPEHNLTSEWDFIYNKAHNEYLNFMANTGTVGILAYLSLIIFSIFTIVKKREIALLAGFLSLLVTNFFGFSVVPTQLQFFLFPAFAVMLDIVKTEDKDKWIKVSGNQKMLIAGVSLICVYLLYSVGKYWNADRLFSAGGGYNSIGKPDAALNFLLPAINLEPGQSVYYGGESGKPGLAYSYVNIAMAYNQSDQKEQVSKYAELAISTIDKAISLSPANINFKRTKFGIYIMLSTVNPNYLIDARDILISAIEQAPTDAKIRYNLGLTYARTGQNDKALEALKETIELKSNYKEARLAYAILLINKGQNSEAKSQLEYILKYLDPNDSLAKQTLESIK